MTSKKQSRKPIRRKVQRHLWLMPDIDAALVEAAKAGDRDINRQATLYLVEGLEREGRLAGAEAAR